MRLLPTMMLLSLTACFGSGKGDDDGSGGSGGFDGWGPVDTGDGSSDDYVPCEETWIDWVGTDDPHVGDEWTVWLRCDDALLTGPTVIQFDPLDFANVDENIITFTHSGKGYLKVQTGAEWAEMDLVVLD